MRRLSSVGAAILAAALAALPQAVHAQADTGPAIEPGAMAALNKMGTYLQTLKSFQVLAKTTVEEVLTDGQKVQFSGATDLLVRRPDRFRAEVDGDRQSRLYFYDGK